VGVFPGDTADGRVKDFGYIYCNATIKSTSLYCDDTHIRIKGTAANGRWEKYSTVGEHRCTANCF
jgi:hypothetical protein